MKTKALPIVCLAGLLLAPVPRGISAEPSIAIDPFQSPVKESAILNGDFSMRDSGCSSGWTGWSLFSTQRVTAAPMPVRGPNNGTAVQLFLKSELPNGPGRMGALMQPIALHNSFSKDIRGAISVRFDQADSTAGIRISDSSGRAILYSYAPNSNPLQIPRTVALKHNVVPSARWIDIPLSISESFQELFQRTIRPPIQVELWVGCGEGAQSAAVSFANLSIERSMPDITAETFRKLLVREIESQWELQREKNKLGQAHWQPSRTTLLLLALATGESNHLDAFLEAARKEANRSINLLGLERETSNRFWTEIPTDLLYAYNLTSDPLFLKALSDLVTGNIQYGLDRNLYLLRPRTLSTNGLETLWQLREGLALLLTAEALEKADIKPAENFHELAGHILDIALDQFQTATGLPMLYLAPPKTNTPETCILGPQLGQTGDLLRALLAQPGSPLQQEVADAFLRGTTSFFIDPFRSGPSLPFGAVHPQSPGHMSRVVSAGAGAAFPGLVNLARQLEAADVQSTLTTQWEILFNCSQWDGLFASVDFAPRLPTLIAEALPDRAKASPSSENLLALASLYAAEPEVHYLQQAYCIFDDIVTRMVLESGGYAAANSIQVRQTDQPPTILSTKADAKTDELIQTMLAWILAIDQKPFDAALLPPAMPLPNEVSPLWFSAQSSNDHPVSGFPQ
ncbi:MAG: hypothetical protein ACOX52_11615 [Verrucomicrobiota bacterium]|jgi:hypothetical protein